LWQIGDHFGGSAAVNFEFSNWEGTVVKDHAARVNRCIK
jgi:hypothetical protein